MSEELQALQVEQGFHDKAKHHDNQEVADQDVMSPTRSIKSCYLKNPFKLSMKVNALSLHEPGLNSNESVTHQMGSKGVEDTSKGKKAGLINEISPLDCSDNLNSFMSSPDTQQIADNDFSTIGKQFKTSLFQRVSTKAY